MNAASSFSFDALNALSNLVLNPVDGLSKVELYKAAVCTVVLPKLCVVVEAWLGLLDGLDANAGRKEDERDAIAKTMVAKSAVRIVDGAVYWKL